MDSEEKYEVEHARRTGKSETDEGPFYHESWWEAYKGGIKGKLGGAIIGAAVGALVGLIAVPILAATGVAAATGLVVAGFSAAGMLYGANDFSSVGKVTGAVASGLEVQEDRMKDFVTRQINGLRREIRGLKGETMEPEKGTALVDQKNRSTHCDNEHCDPKKKKYIFWGIAAVGLAIGAGAGALLGVSGLAVHMLEAVGLVHLNATAVTGVATAVMGLFGASFGINRDLFRDVFDKTDLWFKGCFKRHNGPHHAHEHEMDQSVATPAKRSAYDFSSQQMDAEVSTRHRDQLAAARAALLNMDHTRATPH